MLNRTRRFGIAAIAFLVPLAAVEANASLYNFSYSFASSQVLEGSLDGTLQGDNDTIWISDFGSVLLNGVALLSIEPSDIRSISDFNTGALQPLVSISGNLMDVFVCPLGFTDGNCSFASDGGFFFDSRSGGFGARGHDGQGNNQGAETYVAANWSITAVPEPATIGLFGLGLVGLGLVARRRQTA